MSFQTPSQSPPADDLSALSWVHDEVRRTLEAAHKSLRRYLRESDSILGADVDAVEPAVLRQARAQIHQAAGVLDMIGLPPASALLRASEAAVQKMVARPARVDVPAIETIERASFALLDFVARRLAGRTVSPTALFPQYRAVQELAGADRVHPSDLWHDEVPDITLPGDPGAGVRTTDEDFRNELETQMLVLLRQPRGTAAAQMSRMFAALANGAPDTAPATLWRLAAAVFEGQAHGLLPVNLYGKRLTPRLLALLRLCESDPAAAGASAASARLRRDLLFFCLQAGTPADGPDTPMLAAARRAFGLTGRAGVDYEAPQLGRFDPALIAQARKRVAAMKDAWSAVAGGDLVRLGALGEPFALVGDSLRRLYPGGEGLADALAGAAQDTMERGEAPSPELAMEVATAVLYLEASLEDADFDHPALRERVGRLAQRIATVRSGLPPSPLEGWIEDLYRRVSDRQTMGSVVHELRASLGEAEKLIDQYFRDPAQRDALVPAGGQLQAMRGVFSVLGLDDAAHAVQRMREDVDRLVAGRDGADTADAVERLTVNLGRLGFLVDMLGVQPSLAKSMFDFDADGGVLRSRISEPPAPSSGPAAPPTALFDQAQSIARAALQPEVPDDLMSTSLDRLTHEALVADQPTLAEAASRARAALDRAEDGSTRQSVREDLAQTFHELVQANTPAAIELPAPSPVPPPSPPAAPGQTGLEDDAEMREIFLEEAREVMAAARGALAALADVPDDVAELTAVRRAFHTLKGSSRMVGLNAFGEAAWACEQLYNARLADAPRADGLLLGFTGEALDYLGGWIEAIVSGHDAGHHPQPVQQAADALRLEGRREALPAPEAGISPAPWPAPPEGSIGDFGLDLPTLEEVVGVASAEPERLEAAPLPLEAAPSVQAPPVEAFTDWASSAQPPSEIPSSLAALDGVQAFETTASLAGLELSFDAHGDTPPAGTGVVEAIPEAPEGPSWAQAPNLPESNAAIEAVEPFASVEGAEPAAPAAEVPAEVPAEEATAEAGRWAPETAGPGLDADAEQFKAVGPLRISIPLFNIYLGEADELSRRLLTELAEWAHELDRPVGESTVALAHSLAGSSATVGYHDLSHLARALEHALARSQALGHGTADEAALFEEAADTIRRLLHQFAAGFLPPAPQVLLDRLSAHELDVARQLQYTPPEAAEGGPPSFTGVETPADGQPVGEPVEPALEALTETALPALAEAAGNGPIELPMDVAMGGQPEPTVESAFESFETAESADVVAPAQPGEAAETTPADDVEQPAVEGMAATEGTVDAFVLDVIAPVALLEPTETTAADTPLAPHWGEAGTGASPQAPASAVGDASAATDGWNAALLVGSDDDDDIDAEDTVDADLFPIFEEEAQDLLPQLAARVREWARRPDDASGAAACMRTLHTLKGGARLAGAMRLGEMAHRLETAIERLVAGGDVDTLHVERLQARVDHLGATFEALRTGAAPQPAPALPVAVAAQGEATEEPAAIDAAPTPEMPAEAPSTAEIAAAAPAATPPAEPAPGVPIDWSRFGVRAAPSGAAEPQAHAPHATAAVRIRVPLLDRLVNHAGEVSITRSRIEADVEQIKSSLTDLTDNLERLRRQLRDLELQAETQIASRLEQAKAAAEAFDPLELDRFTRFQELTRMMAESVNDVATVQRSLQRALQSTEDELAAQARLTRELQSDLLRTRMVEFEGLSERLYRVVRQAAKETGKQVRLDIVGGSIEVDRGVLDRMTPAFEHLLRNCVTHGIEAPAVREAVGKAAAGQITVMLTHEGNEVGIEFRDDGGGLNLARIRERGLAMGLITPDDPPSDEALAQLIFAPGFSTADQVTELAGRGIGMDVVRSEVVAMGGRIETSTSAGHGTAFRLVLPLTTAVTQIVMLRCAAVTVAVPSTLVEVVRRATPDEVEAAHASGVLQVGNDALPLYWLGALLEVSPRSTERGRSASIVVVRSARQRVAIQVDEVIGKQEVVVKNLGPQLSRLPGLAGMTLLPSGTPALIYNPVALATLYGERARETTRAAPVAEAGPAMAPVEQAPLVLVVDDSLTVRRVTERLLVREGYRVALAKDGLEALERLAEEKPAIVLSDIEMPRMDGFDLVRNLRGDARWRGLPVIMITSRIAQKHREVAAQLGVDHYLGKPYSEEDLLALIALHVQTPATA